MLRKILKISILLFFTLIIFMIGAAAIVWQKKDTLVSKALEKTNAYYQGLVVLENAEISPFENFPYVSVRLQNLKVYETKNIDTTAIIDVEKTYVGFDFWHILYGNYQIKKISLENGIFNIIQYADETYNIVNAFELLEEEQGDSEDIVFDLERVYLKNIDINKNNLVTNILSEAGVSEGDFSFKQTNNDLQLHFDGTFLLNIFKDKKPTYVYHKHLELHTDFVYHKLSQIIDFEKTTVTLEGADFEMAGTIDIDDGMNVDLKFSGKKPNFDLFIAFAPEDIIPTLRSYDNRGKVYFDVELKGKTANNATPSILASFGCEDGYIRNPEVNKSLDKLGFHGTYTNGPKRQASTSVFRLKDFDARPEAGKFKANLTVKNFDSPEIDMQLDSDFDLDFLAKFFKLKDLNEFSGQVFLSMNFHDIIDLRYPERALERLNQAYFSRLNIRNLHFKSDNYHLPIQNLNVDAIVEGETLDLKNCSWQLGQSDISIRGKVTNVPAVIHQTKSPVNAELHVRSNNLDVTELLPKVNNQPPHVDEVLSKLRFDLSFKGMANTFIASKSLPVGNYYLTNISTQLKHYQHQLDSLNGIFYIGQRDIALKRLDGKIDSSDFHFEGKVSHYDLWLADEKHGDTSIDFDLTSNEIHFNEIFTYQGKNYIPKEYRNEHIQDLKLHGHVDLHYKNELTSTDFYLTELTGKLKIHPLKFHGFNGNVHSENNTVTIREFSGNLGDNDFNLKGTYHLNNSKKFHELTFEAQRLNINELIDFELPPQDEKVDHDAGPNVFEEPFPNLNIDARVHDVRFNKYHLKELVGRVTIQENHYVYFDKLQCLAADGLVDISGYFNGSDPKHIYFNPDIKLQKVDLDQVFIKFDNFGQDMLISENIHGQLTGRITGKILMHTDFTPWIEASDLQMDVMIENGRLDNFAPMQAMASYFGDKNLNRIKFDTLENRFHLKNGALSFPNMTINSSLGFIEIAGSQTVDLDMDYYVRVPIKLVGKTAFGKLFKKKSKKIRPEQEDELIIKDPKKRVRYINLRLVGTPDEYDLSLKKNKDLKEGVEFKRTDDFLFEELESEFDQDDKN